MAKRRVELIEPAETFVEPVEEPTEEQIREWQEEAEAERNERLAPYRAMHEQQNEQDEFIADLLFKETMRELEA